MAGRLKFSYWSDPLCIWALVAQQKLDRVLGELGAHIRVDYRIVPVFGSVPWRFAQGPWSKEGLEGRVLATRKIAEQGGRSDVSGECWRCAMPSSSWAPAAAIKAVFALEDGGEDAGPGYQRALRERFFVGEENIALRTVQLEVAEGLGLPRGPIEQRQALIWTRSPSRRMARSRSTESFAAPGSRARSGTRRAGS